MNEDTAFTKRTKGLLKGHSKTALGGIGGAGLAGLLTLALPFIHDIRQNQAKMWEQQSELRERVVKLEVEVKMMEKESK